MSIRILLIDDHSLFRSGVKQILQREPDFEVVAEAPDGVEGIKRAKALQPDVILLDLNMPGLSGLETLQLLVQERLQSLGSMRRPPLPRRQSSRGRRSPWHRPRRYHR